MSEFELLVIPISLILGLGVTRMLGAYVHLVRLREGASLHWLPVAWSLIVLGYILQFFNYLYDVGQSGEPWNWTQYGPSLFQSMLLFASAGLILPSESTTAPPDMSVDFQKHGRLALIPLGLYLLQAVPTNTLIGGVPWVSPGNMLCVVGVTLLVFAYSSERGTVRAAATFTFAAVSMLGWFVIWSQPGDG